MNRKRELQRRLGRGYAYRRQLSDRDVRRLRQNPPPGFEQQTAATLTAGCLRLEVMLYRSGGHLLLGCDLLVKDDPASPEWICYSTLPAPDSLKEEALLSILDQAADRHGLSYTECCFARLEGKRIEKEKPATLAPVTPSVGELEKG